MPFSRLALILGVVVLLAAATVLLLMALPPDIRPWLIPILMAAALALREGTRRSARSGRKHDAQPDEPRN